MLIQFEVSSPFQLLPGRFKVYWEAKNIGDSGGHGSPLRCGMGTHTPMEKLFAMVSG